MDLSEILRTINLDPAGITSLGDDGIYRSFSGFGSREVIDAVPFSPGLIKALLDRFPYNEDAERLFRGVDGRRTSKDRWYDPAQQNAPEPMTAEQEEETRRLMEEKGEAFFKQKDEQRRSGKGGCGVKIMSDHDILVKDDTKGEAQP